MRKPSFVQASLTVVLSMLLAFPAPLWSQAVGQPGQHAGKVSALVPTGESDSHRPIDYRNSGNAGALGGHGNYRASFAGARGAG